MSAELVPFPARPGAELAELADRGTAGGAFQLFRRMQAQPRQQVPAHLSDDRLVEDWIRHHRDWTASTVTTRRCQIRQLVTYLAGTPLVCATEDDLLNFRDSREVGARRLWPVTWRRSRASTSTCV